MSIIKINSENYEQEVEKETGRVLLDFWADWCGPCKMQAPILDELAKDEPDLKIGKIDVTAEEELAGRFGIRSIPTLALVENGKIIKMEAGLKTKPELIAWMG